MDPSLLDAEIPLKITVEEAWQRLLISKPGGLLLECADLSSGLEATRLLGAWEDKALEPMPVNLMEDLNEELAQEWAEAYDNELTELTELGPGDLLWEDMSTVPSEWLEVTTVMMRNLPNKYTQQMLLMEVNSCGFGGTFDFLYLPIDAETAANRGYAFLNFLDPSSAWMFRCMFEGRKMSRFNSKKVISVVPATLQGFDANYAHYTRARVSRGDPSARPLFWREPGDHLGAPVLTRSTSPWVDAMFPPSGSNAAPSLSRAAGNDCGELPDGLAVEAEGTDRNYVPKFCSQCGGRIQLMFQFCPSCGAPLRF